MNAIFSLIFLADFTYRISPPHPQAATSSGTSGGRTCSQPPFPQLKILRVFRWSASIDCCGGGHPSVGRH